MRNIQFNSNLCMSSSKPCITCLVHICLISAYVLLLYNNTRSVSDLYQFIFLILIRREDENRRADMSHALIIRFIRSKQLCLNHDYAELCIRSIKSNKIESHQNLQQILPTRQTDPTIGALVKRLTNIPNSQKCNIFPIIY